MEPSLDTWTSIFLIASAQGLFLAVMIGLKRSAANVLLAGLIMAFSVCMLYYVAFWTRFETVLPRGIAAAQGLTYLMGPLAWFYIRSVGKPLHFNPWHFIPFGAYLIFFFTRGYIGSEYRTATTVAQVILQNLHLLIYSGLIVLEAWKYHTVRLTKQQENWKKYTAAAFTGYSLSFLSYYVMVWTGTLKIEYDYTVSFAASCFIYFIGYQSFRHPGLLNERPAAKYDKSALSQPAARSILATIKMHMGTHKPYLDSSLKLHDLAKQLSFSAHHISQVINELEQQNFSDFINRYRINDAKEMLGNPDLADNKIIEVAYDTGFNNKTSFSNAFKKFTGMSPSEFKTRSLSDEKTARTTQIR